MTLKYNRFRTSTLLDIEFEIQNSIIRKIKLNYIFCEKISLVHPYEVKFHKEKIVIICNSMTHSGWYSPTMASKKLE